MARTWVDYGKTGTQKRYKSKKAVLKLIRRVVAEDKMLVDTLKLDLTKITDDRLFELGHMFFDIQQID